MVLLFPFAVSLALVSSLQPVRGTPAWPNGPLNSNGTHIVDASGKALIYAGINWPGEGEVMIPEGLQYSSIKGIVDKIKSLGMNAVRMGWATEMVDDILDNGGDVTLEAALAKTLAGNATVILNQIIKNNPSFTAKTTRLQVWDAVAAELYNQQLHLIVNNHVSKAIWCCSPTDGNGWFGDTYFDVQKWKRGLNYMANYAKKWPAATAHSLRNELRLVQGPANATYGWPLWYDEMTEAAAGLHQANPDVLILFSGLNYDHDLSVITAALPLSNTDKRTFKISDFAYAKKIVFELHSYDNGITNDTDLQVQYYSRGFNALDDSSSTTAKNIAPVVLTEFGFAQNGTDYATPYAQAIKGFVSGKDRRGPGARIHGGIGWFEWGISGSYYIREGIQDFDDWWAIFNHNWSGFRNETVLDLYQKPMIRDTLAA